MIQARVTDLSSVKVEVHQSGKAFKMGQPRIGDARLFEMQPTQTFALAHLNKSCIGDFRASQIQPDQLIDFRQMHQAFIIEVGTRQMECRLFLLRIRGDHANTTAQLGQSFDRLILRFICPNNRARQGQQQSHMT